MSLSWFVMCIGLTILCFGLAIIAPVYLGGVPQSGKDTIQIFLFFIGIIAPFIGALHKG